MMKTSQVPIQLSSRRAHPTPFAGSRSANAAGTENISEREKLRHLSYKRAQHKLQIELNFSLITFSKPVLSLYRLLLNKSAKKICLIRIRNLFRFRISLNIIVNPRKIHKINIETEGILISRVFVQLCLLVLGIDMVQLEYFLA